MEKSTFRWSIALVCVVLALGTHETSAGTISLWDLESEGEGEEEYNCSLCVPWFMDSAGAAQGMPARDGGISTLVFLHNNLGEEITCVIEYYTRSGVYIGPMEDKTFPISAYATIAFRPVADDPSTTLYGQEGPEGNAVPDRPRGAEHGNDGKMNGSIVIRWDGDPGDVQGMVRDCQKTPDGVFATTTVLPIGRLTSGKAASPPVAPQEKAGPEPASASRPAASVEPASTLESL